MKHYFDIKCSIHHGVMLVGPSGTGKSTAFRYRSFTVIAFALLYYDRMVQCCIVLSTDRRCLLHALDACTSSVSHVYVIDPKSVKKEELYGTFPQALPPLISS